MIILVKLLLSAATALFGAGFAARRRARGLHRRWMAQALGLALLATVIAGASVAAGWPLRPAFWLADLLGGSGRAQFAAHLHQAAMGTVIALLCAQAWLGKTRHRLHRLPARAVLPLWGAVYLPAMFGYY